MINLIEEDRETPLTLRGLLDQYPRSFFEKEHYVDPLLATLKLGRRGYRRNPCDSWVTAIKDVSNRQITGEELYSVYQGIAQGMQERFRRGGREIKPGFLLEPYDSGAGIRSTCRMIYDLLTTDPGMGLHYLKESRLHTLPPPDLQNIPTRVPLNRVNLVAPRNIRYVIGADTTYLFSRGELWIEITNNTEGASPYLK